MNYLYLSTYIYVFKYRYRYIDIDIPATGIRITVPCLLLRCLRIETILIQLLQGLTSLPVQ